MKTAKAKKELIQSPRSDKFILALLQQPTIEKAAEAAGINSGTAWRWMQNEDFQDRYRNARRKTFGQALARLQHASSAAASTLMKVMIDPKAPAYSRVRAADIILVHAIRAIEVEDIEARLTRLEERESQSSDHNR